MTILAINGFDAYGTDENNITNAVNWAIGNPTYMSMSSTTRFSSGYCLVIHDYPGYVSYTLTDTEFYVGFAFYADGLGTANDYYIFSVFNGSTAPQVSLTMDGSGHLIARRGNQAGTILETATSTVSVDAWHWVEIHIKIDNSAGVFNVQVDGSAHINQSSIDTQQQTTNEVAEFRLGSGNANGSASDYVYYDDLVIQDSSGSALGDSRVETIFPTGDNSVAWSRSAGTTNYENIDEQDPSDTDYVYSAAVNDIDWYDFGNLSSTPDTIHAVQVNARCQKSDTGIRSIAVKTKYSANIQTGANYGLPSSGYDVTSDIFETYNGSNAWTGTEVDGGQFGVEVTV